MIFFPVSQALPARNFFLKFNNSSRDLLSFLKSDRQLCRGPYSFSLRVVSRACKPVMTYLPSYNLGCPDKSAELYKRIVKTLCAIWTFLLAFYFRYSYSEKVLTKLLSTTGYRPRLNTVYLHFTIGRSVCLEGKTVRLLFPQYKEAAAASPFFFRWKKREV